MVEDLDTGKGGTWREQEDKFGMKYDTGLQKGSTGFGCMQQGLRMSAQCGIEEFQKCLEI